MSFHFAEPRQRRRPSLTPMIDVVFLLLVFFMLAARFGHDSSLPLTLGSGSGAYSGPPRLVEIAPEALRLNGQAATLETLLRDLPGLMAAPEDIIVLRAAESVDLQRLVTVLEALRAAGLTNLALVE